RSWESKVGRPGRAVHASLREDFMFRSASSRRWLAATSLLAVLTLGACSSSDNSTKPPGGGVAKELNSPNLGHSEVHAHTFPMTPTTYNYHCKFHGNMTASVVVQAGGAAAAAVTITDNAFSTNSTTIGPGGTVTWTNNGGNTHSVTSD